MAKIFARDGVTRLGMLHDVCNTSDHDPIVVHLQLAVTRFNSVPKHFRSKPAWYRASETQLKDYVGYPRCLLGDIVRGAGAMAPKPPWLTQNFTQWRHDRSWPHKFSEVIDGNDIGSSVFTSKRLHVEWSTAIRKLVQCFAFSL